MDYETYEDAGTTFRRWAFTPQALDFAIGIDLVILENGHLNLFTFMLNLFGGLSQR